MATKKRDTPEKQAKARLADKKWYEANKAKRMAMTKRWEAENIRRYHEYKKTQKCQHCGESNYLVLQFHHLDPSQKDFEVSTQVRNHSFEKLMDEIKKCIVLCANCHICEHHRQKVIGI